METQLGISFCPTLLPLLLHSIFELKAVRIRLGLCSACVCDTCEDERSEELEGVSSLLPPYRFPGSKSGHQA